jgi:hypothetical protein
MMMIVVLVIVLWTDEIVSGGMFAEHAPIRIVGDPAAATIEQLRLRVEFSPMEITPVEISTTMVVMMIGSRGGNKRMVQTLWTMKVSRELNLGLWVWLIETIKAKSFSGHPVLKGKIKGKRKWKFGIVEIVETVKFFEIRKRGNVPFWNIVPTSMLVPSHMRRNFVEYCSSPSLSCCLCLLHTIRYLNHEICVRQVRVFSSGLRHGFISRFLHLLLVDLLNIVVKSASTLVRIAEMIVVCNVLRAYIATKGQSVTHKTGFPLTIACCCNSGISSCCSRVPL